STTRPAIRSPRMGNGAASAMRPIQANGYFGTATSRSSNLTSTPHMTAKSTRKQCVISTLPPERILRDGQHPVEGIAPVDQPDRGAMCAGFEPDEAGRIAGRTGKDCSVESFLLLRRKNRIAATLPEEHRKLRLEAGAG